MKKTFLDTRKKKSCNGCGVCAIVCPKKCIEMKEDSEGFLYPEIDKSKCIKCNKCRQVCSNFNNKTEENEKAYAVINKSDKQLKKSSSGGMFLILAQYVIQKSGVVFGVTYNENLEVIHNYAEKMEDVFRFCGSKYVRSNLNGCYEKVKEFLENDRYVLFTGTPCQISGLKNYLNKDYEKLILCDIICHANPSPKIFKMFVENLEEKTGKKIKTIHFRYKEDGWREENTIIEYENGEKQKDNSFVNAFGYELINRPSCHTCPFVTRRRISDMTIGDFWGAKEVIPEADVKKGVSLVIVGSKKGKQIFNEIKEKINYKSISYDIGVLHNHFENVLENANRSTFFRLIKHEKITKENIIESMEKYTIPKSIPKRALRKIKYLSLKYFNKNK